MMQATITEVLAEAFGHEPITFECSHCHDTFPLEERNCFDDAELCTDCFGEHTVCCQHCGEILWSDDIAGDSNTPFCQDCFDSCYTTCEHCGCMVSRDDAFYDDTDDDSPYCQSCYDRLGIGRIHDYSYKPCPIFYGDGPRFFGVELEIDGAGKDGNHAWVIEMAANKNTEHIYIKSDGSLDDGMEIVTHPRSLAYHLEHLPWQDIVDKALALGYKSHKASTCGLHIHVNRSAFGGDVWAQEECIGRASSNLWSTAAT